MVYLYLAVLLAVISFMAGLFAQKKPEKIMLDIKLHCPDGLDESLGFNLPDELNEFLKYISDYSKEEGYSFTVTRTSITEIMTFLKEEVKQDEIRTGKILQKGINYE